MLPEPMTRGIPPPDPHFLSPLSSTEYVNPPPKKYMVTPLIQTIQVGWLALWLVG